MTSQSRISSFKFFALGAVLILIAGCSSKLATGYEPRKLGASESVRRTYYASPYSPDSHPAPLGQDSAPPMPGG